MSAGSSLTRLCKDLLDRMSSGFSQHLLTGTSRTLAKIFTKKDLPQNNHGTTVLCEPVQSKCTRTLEQFYARIYPKNAGAQLQYPRFVPACAVEMHMDILQEPFYARTVKKNAGSQPQYTHVLCEPAQSKCTWASHKSNIMWEFSGKCWGPTLVRACAVEMHIVHARIYGENTGAKDQEKSHHRLCASLRSWNAHGHVTRAILCENLPEKTPSARERTRSNPGLDSYTELGSN